MHRFMMRKALQTIVLTIASTAALTIAAFSGALKSVVGESSNTVGAAMSLISIAMLFFIGIDIYARDETHEWKGVVFSIGTSVAAGMSLSFFDNKAVVVTGSIIVGLAVFFVIFFTKPDKDMISSSDAARKEVNES